MRKSTIGLLALGAAIAITDPDVSTRDHFRNLKDGFLESYFDARNRGNWPLTAVAKGVGYCLVDDALVTARRAYNRLSHRYDKN